MGGLKRAEFESVMADTGEKVETKAGKVNTPDDAPDETLAAHSGQYGGTRWRDANRSAREGGV